MSQVSPVFHTEVTVKLASKTNSEWEHPIHSICGLNVKLMYGDVGKDPSNISF